MSKLPNQPKPPRPLNGQSHTFVDQDLEGGGLPLRITVMGAGYVGLVTAACFAEQGHLVTLLDVNSDRIAALRQGQTPIFEAGLDELLQRNIQAERLRLATEPADAVRQSQVVFIAVGTPCNDAGEADTSAVFEAARGAAPWLAVRTVLVTKSTVPPGTGEALRHLLSRLRPGLDISVASNPEFLRQGSAVADFMAPDRVIFGCHDERGRATLMRLYGFARAQGTPVLSTSLENAELAKYAANAFLAMKIAFINEVADLCEAVGGDVREVAAAIGLDKRIGPHCLAPGPGFGGSCFPKDTRALASTGRRYGVAQRLAETVIQANEFRMHEMSRRILAALGSPRGKCVAVLGAAFKAGTDDTRDSPAATIVPDLERAGVTVRICDPEARSLPGTVRAEATWHTSPLAAARGADAAVVLTEWPQFAALDLAALAKAMRGRLLIDMRNVIRPSAAQSHQLQYIGIGVSSRAPAAPNRHAPKPATDRNGAEEPRFAHQPSRTALQRRSGAIPGASYRSTIPAKPADG